MASFLSSIKRRAAGRKAHTRDRIGDHGLQESSLSAQVEIPDNLDTSGWRDTDSDPGTPEFRFSLKDYVYHLKTIRDMVLSAANDGREHDVDLSNDFDGSESAGSRSEDDEELELQRMENALRDEICELLPRIAAEGNILEKMAVRGEMMFADWKKIEILQDEFTILSTIRSKILNLRTNFAAKILIDWLGQLDKDVTDLCFLRLTDLPLDQQDDPASRQEIRKEESPARQRIGRIRGILVKALKIAKESRVPGVKGTDPALEDIRKRLEGTALMGALSAGGFTT